MLVGEVKKQICEGSENIGTSAGLTSELGFRIRLVERIHRPMKTDNRIGRRYEGDGFEGGTLECNRKIRREQASAVICFRATGPLLCDLDAVLDPISYPVCVFKDDLVNHIPFGGKSRQS